MISFLFLKICYDVKQNSLIGEVIMDLNKILDTPQDPLVLDMMRKLQEQQSASAELFANPEVTNRVKNTLNTMRDTRARDPGHAYVDNKKIEVTPRNKGVKKIDNEIKSLYATTTTTTTTSRSNTSLKGHNITAK